MILTPPSQKIVTARL